MRYLVTDIRTNEYKSFPTLADMMDYVWSFPQADHRFLLRGVA